MNTPPGIHGRLPLATSLPRCHPTWHLPTRPQGSRPTRAMVGGSTALSFSPPPEHLTELNSSHSIRTVRSHTPIALRSESNGPASPWPYPSLATRLLCLARLHSAVVAFLRHTIQRWTSRLGLDPTAHILPGPTVCSWLAGWLSSARLGTPLFCFFDLERERKSRATTSFDYHLPVANPLLCRFQCWRDLLRGFIKPGIKGWVDWA